MSIFLLSVIVCFSVLNCGDITEIKSPNALAEVPDSLKGRLWNIPYLSDIKIDGKATDWEDKGAEVRFFANSYGNVPARADLQAKMRMAWCTEGLLLFVDVSDDAAWEDKSGNTLWEGDAVDIFMSEAWGVQNTIQLIISPGWAKQSKQLRMRAIDHRNKSALRETDIQCTVASQFTNGKYSIETLIPFSNLGIVPTEGNEFGLQVYVHDTDAKNSGNQTVEWHYLTQSYLNPFSLKRVRLTQHSADDHNIAVKSYIQDFDTAFIHLLADSSYIGKHVMLFNDNKLLAEAHLQPDSMGASIKFVWNIANKVNQHITPHIFIDSIFFEIIDLSFVNIRYKYTSSVRFADYMRRFTVYDDYRPEKQNAIVFTGSSTITKWFTLEDDLQPMNVVNRGFGGSEAVDVLRNFRTLFLPLKPRKIVFYEGDNDIAAGLDPLAFVDTCRSIIDSIHNVLPNTQIYILSIKPSPGRKKFWDKMKLANDSLQTFPKKYNFVKYIDIASPLLNENGEMRKELFLSDYVHLNKEGYKVLKEAIRKEMEDELK